MRPIQLVALPCLCVDVFDGTDQILPGGEALNFAAQACRFPEIQVSLLGIIGKDTYAQSILNSIAEFPIDASQVRVNEAYPTASNYTYLTPEGDRYYHEDSWDGRIFDGQKLTPAEIDTICHADVVFVNFWAFCFREIIALKKTHSFRLAVDFDVYRNFDDMEQYAPYVDYFMISGSEEFLPIFENFSKKYDGLFNMSLAERGSVTYEHGHVHQVKAVPVKAVIDTTGCGDAYHAGFVCAHMLGESIEAAMQKGSEIASEVLSHYGGF